MTDAKGLSDETNRLVQASLASLAAGDTAARGDLIAIASDRMRGFAHRMLQSFPRVRRWDQTDDVMQNASMRLYQALSKVTPPDARAFLGLAAIQIRRELLDLARKHAGPESYAANHETNFMRIDGVEKSKIANEPDPAPHADRLHRWTRLHEIAACLPEEEREIFHLAWYMGLKQEEIADLVGCSVRTVKRRWESAKALIAKEMHGDEPA